MTSRPTIALGLITRYLDHTSPYLDFIKNAEDYGHRIEALIVAFSHGYKRTVINRLKRHVNLHLIKINHTDQLQFHLQQHGIGAKMAARLLKSFTLKQFDLLPYGLQRNNVLLAAMVEGFYDYLFFVDTDVYPRLLVDDNRWEEIDYFGRHLEYLAQEGVVATTSDYSGYYIIPPLPFKQREDLLFGLQKQDALPLVAEGGKNLVFATSEQKNIGKTEKILGGNMAIDLSNLKLLSPFFSTTYRLDDQLFLGRGEDTLMGIEIPAAGGRIIDVDTLIFHNTFGNYPRQPDLLNEEIQQRLFYACTGWLGRNPFLNWYLMQRGRITREELAERRREQRERLPAGSEALAKYTGNRDFLILPQAFDAAWEQLDSMLEDYRQTTEAWDEIVSKLKGGQSDEDFTGQSLSP